MGMTDKQFNLHLRLLIKQLKDARSQDDKEIIVQKIDDIVDALQKSLED